MIRRRIRIFLVPLTIILLFSSVGAAGTVTYDYDNLHRIVKMEKAGDYTIEYAYDTAGNRTETITQVQGPVFDHDSDADIDGADVHNFMLNFDGSAQALYDFSQLFGTQN